MNKTTLILLAGLPLLAIQAFARSTDTPEDPILVIAAEGRCVPTAGIPIKEVPDNQVKYACLRDRGVTSRCNMDGYHASIEAFRQWESQLMEFKVRCASVTGTFAFAN